MSEKAKKAYDLRRLRNDIILIAVILLAAAVGLLLYVLTAERGSFAVVFVDGEEMASYSLSRDTEEVIETEYGFNTVVIRDGKASVTDADCPDGICVSYRAIGMRGETIVCLPHKLVVEIIAQTDTDIIS